MKKLISLGLVGVMALSMVPMAYATTDYENGTKVEYVADADANGDAFVDAIDVTIVAALINEFEEPETEYIMAAIDLCEDGWLDAIDLTVIINIANMAF